MASWHVIVHVTMNPRSRWVQDGTGIGPIFFHQDHHLLSNLGIRSGTTPERFANPTGSSGASTPATVKTGLCLGRLKLGEWLCLLLFAGHGERRGAGFV